MSVGFVTQQRSASQSGGWRSARRHSWKQQKDKSYHKAEWWLPAAGSEGNGEVKGCGVSVTQRELSSGDLTRSTVPVVNNAVLPGRLGGSSVERLKLVFGWGHGLQVLGASPVSGSALSVDGVCLRALSNK